MMTKTDYEKSKAEVRSRNSDMSMEDLADKYRGVKTREHMVRTALNSALPEEYSPEKLGVATKVGEWDSNAYSFGYDKWELSMPIEGSLDYSIPEILAEEIGHNIDRGVRPELNLDDTEESTYREFAAAVLRDTIFPGNMESIVEDYRTVNQEIEEYYGAQVELAEKIQQRMPFMLENLEKAKERVEDDETDSGPHWMNAYDSQLLANLDELGLEVKMPGRESVELPNPSLLYENHKVGYPRPEWISGSMPSSHFIPEDEIVTPKETIQQVEEDLERTPEQFVENNQDFFKELVVKAKEEANFDQAHVVGRELYVRKKQAEEFGVEELVEMSGEEIEELVTEEAEPIIQEYGLDHENFVETNFF